MRVIDLSILNAGVRGSLSQLNKGKILNSASRSKPEATNPHRCRVGTGSAVREELKELIKYWKAGVGAARGDATVTVKKKQSQRKGFDIVRDGQTIRERFGNPMMATGLNSVQAGRQDVPEARTWGAQESVGTAVRPSRDLPYLETPFLNLKRRTEIKKDREVKMRPAPKEKRYFCVVKSTKGDQVLAEVSPAGDADSWSAYFPKDAFKERVPKVGDEFEYTVTPFGQYNVVRTRLLPERPHRDPKDLGIDEQALLVWAANLHV